MFYFLLLLTILAALFCHDRFCKKIETAMSALLLAGPYGMAIFLSLLFLKVIQGWGEEEAIASFQSVGNLFKYGTVAIFLAVIFPLLLAFIRDCFAGRREEEEP